MNHLFKRILSILSRSFRYLEVGIKALFMPYRFSIVRDFMKSLSKKNGNILATKGGGGRNKFPLEFLHFVYKA